MTTTLQNLRYTQQLQHAARLLDEFATLLDCGPSREVALAAQFLRQHSLLAPHAAPISITIPFSSFSHSNS